VRHPATSRRRSFENSRPLAGSRTRSSADGQRRRPRRSRAADRHWGRARLAAARWTAGPGRCCRGSSKSRCRRIGHAIGQRNITARPRLRPLRFDCSSFVPSCRAVRRNNPVPEGPATVSNSLTEAILLSHPVSARGGAREAGRPPYIRLCSGVQTGYQRAIKATFRISKFLDIKAPDIP
jgi:hypothetical protein